MAESIKKLILFLQSNVRIKARYVSQVTKPMDWTRGQARTETRGELLSGSIHDKMRDKILFKIELSHSNSILYLCKVK